MRKGAIILCGGRSSRMGRDKAMLPFGPELLLQRVVRIVGEVVDPCATIVVAAADQELPTFTDEVQVFRDEAEHLGPLAALEIGLRAIGDRADAVFVTGCDAPLLVPAFAERLFELLGSYDAAIPYDAEHVHTLSAVYKSQIVGEIDKLRAAGQYSMRALASAIHTRRVLVEELRAVDPELFSLKNVNSELEYAAALELAGLNRT
jgi:molybdopterin-guanine dinucleotide biosynthesis protein A